MRKPIIILTPSQYVISRGLAYVTFYPLYWTVMLITFPFRLAIRIYTNFYTHVPQIPEYKMPTAQELRQTEKNA